MMERHFNHLPIALFEIASPSAEGGRFIFARIPRTYLWQRLQDIYPMNSARFTGIKNIEAWLRAVTSQLLKIMGSEIPIFFVFIVIF